MTKSTSRKLDFSRKLLLSTAGFLAVVVPLTFGLVKPTKGQAESQAQETLPLVPAFESAMIRPNNGEPMAGFTIIGKPFKAIMWKGDRFMATNFTLHNLIQKAYDVQDDQILGGPEWVNTEGYDVDAKLQKSVADELQRVGRDQRLLESRHMLQALLADRFRLSFHHETKEVPVYALVIAENGLKIQGAMPGDTYPNGFKRSDGTPVGEGAWSEPGKFVSQGVPIASLVQDLSDYVHRTVLDKTGLSDKYDFTLQWAPEESQPAMFAAIRDQLGLKLEPQTAPVEVLVIDHAEKVPGDEPSQSHSSRRTFSSPVLSGSLMPHQVAAPSQPQDIANSPKYEIVSIKPDNTGSDQRKLFGSPEGITATNVTLQMLIAAAYGVQDDQILGAPKWVNTENYDLEAKMDTSVADKLRKLGEDQRNLERQHMLQALLADRFKLVLHREAKEVSGYALVIAKGGPKLHEAKPGDTYPNGLKNPQGRPLGAGFLIRPGTMPGPEPCQLIGQGVPIADLVGVLSGRLGSSVVDETGLKGNYDFTIDCQKAFMELGGSIWTFLLEQLGLELKPQTAPIQTLVIDHAEKITSDESS